MWWNCDGHVLMGAHGVNGGGVKRERERERASDGVHEALTGVCLPKCTDQLTPPIRILDLNLLLLRD